MKFSAFLAFSGLMIAGSLSSISAISVAAAAPQPAKPANTCNQAYDDFNKIAERVEDLCDRGDVKGIDDLMAQIRAAAQACATQCSADSSRLKECSDFPSTVDKFKSTCLTRIMNQPPFDLELNATNVSNSSTAVPAANVAVQAASTPAKPSKPNKPAARPGLTGDWNMTKAECLTPQGLRPTKYDAVIDLTLQTKTFTAIGTVSGFSCEINGTYVITGDDIDFKISDAGGCPIQDYLPKTFTGTVNGNSMTVRIGGKAASLVCDSNGSTIQAHLKRH